MSNPDGTPTPVFVSYSHQDKKWLKRLQIHLKPLVRAGDIDLWDDTRIRPGADWKAEIDCALTAAGVAVLLVSADFLASDFCYDVEMARALERHQQGTARVVPVILRPCEWRSTPLGELKALPLDGRPVREWPDPDRAFTEIVKGLLGSP